MKLNKLTPEEERIMLSQGTEPPFSGEYDKHFAKGTYVCRQCEAPLYFSENKFDSGCGWPSFDDEIPGAVKRVPDPDGKRTEIVCQSCGGHLGHVFTGEELTPKNTRHCVNSLSLRFIPVKKETEETAVFGGGCFWCTESIFSKLKGVISVMPGYAGGETEHPTYEEVCTGKTGHAEVIKVVFDPTIISYKTLLEVFFHTHDPTQKNRQGADVGEQYRSTILFTTPAQKEAAENFIKTFEKPIVTEVKPLKHFYEAETYHQRYFERNPEQSYCTLVISPKLAKFQAQYATLLKEK